MPEDHDFLLISLLKRQRETLHSNRAGLFCSHLCPQGPDQGLPWTSVDIKIPPRRHTGERRQEGVLKNQTNKRTKDALSIDLLLQGLKTQQQQQGEEEEAITV